MKEGTAFHDHALRRCDAGGEKLALRPRRAQPAPCRNVAAGARSCAAASAFGRAVRLIWLDSFQENVVEYGATLAGLRTPTAATP